MKTQILRLFGFAVLLVVGAAAQNASDMIMDEAVRPSPMDKQLRVLTDEIGGRVPGTPAMDRAIEWGLASFKEAGGENVHAEPFTIARSWTEGDTRFHVTAPMQFGVRAVSF